MDPYAPTKFSPINRESRKLLAAPICLSGIRRDLLVSGRAPLYLFRSSLDFLGRGFASFVGASEGWRYGCSWRLSSWLEARWWRSGSVRVSLCRLGLFRCSMVCSRLVVPIGSSGGKSRRRLQHGSHPVVVLDWRWSLFSGWSGASVSYRSDREKVSGGFSVLLL